MTSVTGLATAAYHDSLICRLVPLGGMTEVFLPGTFFSLLAISVHWRPLSHSFADSSPSRGAKLSLLPIGNSPRPATPQSALRPPAPLRGTPRVGTAVFVPYNTRGLRDGTGAAPYGVTCRARFLFHNGNSPTHAALQIPHPPPQYISVLFPRKIELFVLSKMPLFAIMIYY